MWSSRDNVFEDVLKKISFDYLKGGIFRDHRKNDYCKISMIYGYIIIHLCAKESKNAPSQ